MIKNNQSWMSHSASLWNYTLSPGWTEQEVQILKLALMKFGIGKWRKIINSQCLPGKSIGQIYMQTQRLLGQQSLGDFMGLQVDMEKIYLRNLARKDAYRKNNIIINTGDNMTQEERKKRIAENKRIYGLSQEFIDSIKLPRFHIDSTSSFLTLEEIENRKFTNLEKLQYLTKLEFDIKQKLGKLENGEIIEEFELPIEPTPKKRRAYIKQQSIVVVSLTKVKEGKFIINDE